MALYTYITYMQKYLANTIGMSKQDAMMITFCALLVFGGSAEYVALWLKDIGHEHWFYWYITAGIFISLIMFIFMKDIRTNNKMDGEPHG